MLSLLPTIIHLIPSPSQINNVSLNAVLIIVGVTAMLRGLEISLEEVADDPKLNLRKLREVCNIIVNLLCYFGTGFLTLASILTCIYQNQLKELLIFLGLLVCWNVFLRIVKKWNKERQLSKSETDKDENQEGSL